MAEQLLNDGINPDLKDANGETPLHEAAERGLMDIVTLLIERGANVNTQDKFGFTPIYRAALYGQFEVVSYLIRKNADVNITQKNGISTLYVAASNHKTRDNRKSLEEKRIEIMRRLVKAGVDVKAKTKKHWNALHGAAKHGNAHRVKVLLELGVPADAVSKHGDLPFDIAARKKDFKMMKIFYRHALKSGKENK